jgi:hypothetical protein
MNHRQEILEALVFFLNSGFFLFEKPHVCVIFYCVSSTQRRSLYVLVVGIRKWRSTLQKKAPFFKIFVIQRFQESEIPTGGFELSLQNHNFENLKLAHK